MSITSVLRRTVLAVLVGVSVGAAGLAPASATGDGPRAGDGFAGWSGEAGVGGSRTAGPSVGPTLPGIDVSHWQGTIDWRKVARAGTAFVFMKATDGHDFLDPTFLTNRAGARANGLRVGAYHFARPDASKGDAVEEARWFVRRADPQPGHLLPVLDIETSKGLDQQEVTLWARRWIAEVRRLTGVTPLVYTSPYGWMARTGDSRALARDGAPLWVAHWGVPQPTLPAGDWDGRGWRVWQYTSQGHVAGIAGRVDLDVTRGKTLARITIRRLTLQVDGGAGRVTSSPLGLGCGATCAHSVDPNATVTLRARPDDHAYFTGWGGECRGNEETCVVEMRGNRTVRASFVTDITPPTATLSVAAGFTGPARAEFDERVRGVDARNVVIRREGSGGVAVPAARTCRSGSGERVACAGGAVRSVVLMPRDPFVPGRDYAVVVNPSGADPVVDRVGNPAARTIHGFEAPLRVEQGHVPVVRRPSAVWRSERAVEASGGSFILSDRAGASVSMRFVGRGVHWLTVTGPNRGRARVLIDGKVVRTVDLYSPVRTFGVVQRVEGLSPGSHVVRIEVTGRKSGASAGRFVAIDRFDVLP
jgi:GH25 family lysozyme M1 (1,4-beta-N-acetylmuramidase)